MRYLPLTPDDRTAMLAAIGAKSIDDLFVDVPQAARLDGPVDLPRVAGELEVERALSAMAAKNATAAAARPCASIRLSRRAAWCSRRLTGREARQHAAGQAFLTSSS